MTGRAYVDFDLVVEAGQAGSYRVRVSGSPAGETRWSSVGLPFTGQDGETLTADMDPGAGRTFGTEVFRSVFTGDAGAAWTRSLDLARDQGRGLRLRLRLTEVPELARWPWELLYDERAAQFVALSGWTPVVRYLDVPNPPAAVAVAGPIQVLVLVAAPTDLRRLGRLDVDGEVGRLRGALAGLEGSGRVHVERVGSGRLDDLQRRLRRAQVHVLHYIGHGGVDPDTGEAVLALEGADGSSDLVGADHLATLVSDHRALRLVVLNACEGARGQERDSFAGIAQTLIRRGLPAVVAMQDQITDAAAVTFAATLYEAIADRYPVDAAVSEARKAMAADRSTTEWATPVLYLRAPDGILFQDHDWPAAAQPAAAQPDRPGQAPRLDPAPAGSGPGSASPEGGRSGVGATLRRKPVRAVAQDGQRRWTRRRVFTVILAAVVLTVAIAAALLTRTSTGSTGPTNPGDASYTATGPWRLRIHSTNDAIGCTVTLTDVAAGTSTQVASTVYGVTKVQVQQTGDFRWQANDPHCLITPIAGSGAATLPFVPEERGDTDTFPAPASAVAVQAREFLANAPRCVVRLFDSATGQALDLATATPQADTVILQARGTSTVYLNIDYCVALIYAQR